MSKKFEVEVIKTMRGSLQIKKGKILNCSKLEENGTILYSITNPYNNLWWENFTEEEMIEYFKSVRVNGKIKYI